MFNGFQSWYVGGGVKVISEAHIFLFASFNPWYVGGVKSKPLQRKSLAHARFNPWYVGGGVKSCHIYILLLGILFVSILGMLEGVLKQSIPILCGGLDHMFQSLVCWRGC